MPSGDLKRLGQRAKDLAEKRGGTEALKEDAAELKEIAGGNGSLGDKAKAAAAALKDPGAADAPAEGAADAPASGPAADGTDAEIERAHEKVEGEARGKHGDSGGGGKHRRGRRGRGGRGRRRV